MNYSKLKYFYETAKTLNQTRAAQKLFVSQTAISRHILDLEYDLKASLFTRTNRDLALTPAGKKLFEICDAIFSREDEIYQTVRGASKQEIGKLEIGFMGTSFVSHIKELIESFQKDHPHLELIFKSMSWGAVTSAVENGEIDLGVKVCI